IDYEWAVKLNRFSLSAICLWPAEEQDIRKQFWIKLRTMTYFLLITFVCTIPCLYALIKECDTLMEVTDNLAYSIPLTITVIKFIIVSSKKEVLLPIVNMIAEDWAKLKTDFEERVMIRRARMARIINIFGYILVCILIWLLMVFPRFGITIRYITNVTDIKKLLPLPTYYMYDVSETPYFEIMYIIQSTSLLVATFCYTGIDNFFGVVILHICGQLENLRFHLSNMKESQTSNQILAATIEDHIRLIRAINVIENTSTLLVLALLINFGTCACIYGLLLITVPAGKEEFSVIRVVYLICNFANTFLQTFLYFMAGQMLVTQSERVHDAVYECEWDENIVSVVLKEEPGDRFDPDYMEDICSGTFEKVFLPIENNEVDFSNEMVKLELDGESSSHQNWTAQIASTNLCDKEDGAMQRCLTNANFAQVHDAEKHSGFCPNGQQPKFYKIQCSICKKWFLNNDSMVTHLRMHCSGNQCEVCQQNFQDSSSLHAHMLTHVGMSPLECNICQKRFAYKWCLRSHMQMHVLEKPYDNDTLQQKSSLNRHVLTHTEERPYKCDVCFAAFREKAKLNMHMTLHGGNKQFKCTMCHRSFTQKTALNNHMLAHSGEKPHACNICEKTYKRKSELIRHTMVHTGERPYECKECLMTFREKAKLNSHMLVHTGEKPHECHICHKACARKSDLNSHMLLHTGGQYDCKVCDKIFTRKSDLNRHTLIHTGEKPFACELCNMAFREKTRLNSHMLIHTGDKRHACHICHKTFKEKSSLRKHMLSHTGDRPYECYVCHKAFTQKTTLNSHILVHAGERPYECSACQKIFKDKAIMKKHLSVHINEKTHECLICLKKFTHKAALNSHLSTNHTS
ncbi:Zinc finger protein 84, partial [Melipona quadrifasciata]